VNTQGIGKQDAWSHFMKLTQDARLRNNGLSSGISAVSTSKSSSAASVQANKVPLILKGMSYSKGQPDVKKVILGGKFDAYA